MTSLLEPILWFYWLIVSKIASWAFYSFKTNRKHDLKLVWLAGYAKTRAEKYLNSRDF